jgi:nicotinamidase/pyrazinamidase
MTAEDARALLLVDIQNDFLPGGALAVPDGEQVIPVANRLMRQFELVVATQDWHPPDHLSFASNHNGLEVGDETRFGGKPQTLWPDHCVQGTPGAELAEHLEREGIERVFRKGVAVDADGYSGFAKEPGQATSPLEDFLKQRGVTNLFVMGLATDYCVQATARDAVRAGFKTHLVEDGCRGVDRPAGRVEEAKRRMREAGVEFARSGTLE